MKTIKKIFQSEKQNELKLIDYKKEKANSTAMRLKFIAQIVI